MDIREKSRQREQLRQLAELARSLSEAPAGAAASWDPIFEDLLGRLWEAAMRGDHFQTQRLAREYQRHLIEKMHARYGTPAPVRQTTRNTTMK